MLYLYSSFQMPTACLNNSVLDCVIRMTRILTQQSDLSLLKQLYDHLLFNPTLWLRASPEVQVRLYAFLASDLVARSRVYNNVRRTASILLALHSLKHYYYVVPPAASASSAGPDPSGPPSGSGPRSSTLTQRTPVDNASPSLSKLPGIPPSDWISLEIKFLDVKYLFRLLFDVNAEGTIRPAENQVIMIRGWILAHLRQLVQCSGRMAPEEIESVLNYLSTVREVNDNELMTLY